MQYTNFRAAQKLRTTYVGETRNRLGTRSGQHEYNIEVKNMSHAIKEKHAPNFDQAEILFMERNHKARQIKEIIGIKQTKNNLNIKTDTLALSTLGVEPKLNQSTENPN